MTFHDGDGEWLGNYTSHFPQDSGMHLVRSHRFMYVQIAQVVSNLIFSYSGSDFAPQVSIFQSIYLRGMGREIASEE